MRLVVEMTREEVVSAVAAWFPFELRLSDNHPGRTLELSTLDELTLVEDVGVRLSCTGVLTWPLPLLPDTYRVECVTVLVRLALIRRDSGVALQTTISFDELSVDHLPGLLEHGAAKLISKAVNDGAQSAAWSLTDTLRFHGDVSDRVTTMRSAGFVIPTGKLEITAEKLRLSGDGVLSFVHETA